MELEIYSGSVNGLTQWCRSAGVLTRYNEHICSELEHVADAALIKHLKKLQKLSSSLLHGGANEPDFAVMNSLLTDVFCVASYEKWDHPMQFVHSAQITELPEPGFYGQEDGAVEEQQSALLYVIDAQQIALSRCHQADCDAG